MEPFGLALKDYYEGNLKAKVIIHRDDGYKDDYYISHCFRSPSEFSFIEKLAVSSCQGKVLDIGAGVGPHSLELQKMGLEVWAIDISSHACDIMKKRGVKNVQCAEVYELDESNFDTFLLMGRAIGFVEDLTGLKRFLNHSKKLLNLEGIILLDSFDVRTTTVPKHLAYHENNRQLGRYFGEINLQMEFKGKFGERFKLLFIDPQTLIRCAQEVKMSCEILFKEENGNFWPGSLL